MADLNKVFLMGRLTHDPELRFTGGGAAVADLRLATSRSWTGKDGERKEDTLYIDVTVWNRQAENCCQYLKKGRGVHVEGYLKMESWETQAGEKRTKIKVEADRVQFLDRRDDGPGSGPGSSGGEDEFAPGPARDREAGPARRAPSGGGGAGGGRPGGFNGPSAPPRRPTPTPPPVDTGGDDEDIPF